MEKRKLVPVVAVAICFLFSLCSVAWAGIESSPFKPEIHKLNAIENNLHSIQKRLNHVLQDPPDPGTPSPNVKGVVHRLSAMEYQLILINHMLNSVMDEVLQEPPEPGVPADLLPALEGVRAASQRIADSINAYLQEPPDPQVPAAFIRALTNVGIASQNIADDAVNYMRGGPCTPGVSCGCVGIALPCTGFTNSTSCNSQAGCRWSDATTWPPCIGTPTPCSGFDLTTCGSQAGCHVGICIDGYCQ